MMTRMGLRWIDRVVVLGLTIGVAGCFGNSASEFPPGLEPIDDNRAPAPQGTPDDRYPERLETVHGDDVENDHMFAHSRGFVHASAAKVWLALKDPEVVTDRRNTTRHMVTYDSEPEYDFSMLIHYQVEDIVLVEWDEMWRYGVLDGSLDNPDLGAVRFQKTFGTNFINLLEGSMSLTVIEDGVVEVGFVRHLKAAMTDSDTMAGHHADIFANILASVRGEPLPQF